MPSLLTGCLLIDQACRQLDRRQQTPCAALEAHRVRFESRFGISSHFWAGLHTVGESLHLGIAGHIRGAVLEGGSKRHEPERDVVDREVGGGRECKPVDEACSASTRGVTGQDYALCTARARAGPSAGRIFSIVPNHFSEVVLKASALLSPKSVLANAISASSLMLMNCKHVVRLLE